MSADDSSRRVVAALEQMNIDYELIPCEPELADTAIFCEHYGYPLSASANTILVAGKSGDKGHVACVVLASTRVDVNRTVRKRMGVRRVSFASAAQTQALTGMLPGGVTPIGLPPDVPLWVDRRVVEQPFVILGGGSRSLKIKISPEVFGQTPNTTLVEHLAIEPT